MTTIQKTNNESIVLAIMELAAQMLKKGSSLTNIIGLTTQQWMVLLYVQGDTNIPYAEERIQEGGILASDIAEALNVSRPNITNLLQILADKGLITQDKDPKDKRRKVLVLTRKGRDAIAKVAPLRENANRRLLYDFSEEEKEDLLSKLMHCLDRLHGRA
ncbi:MarR family winged helix-turn-helix transcriptional regulator [Bernardetia sp. OM2101]|uniref:MarR family winged helix-turn-helix transcriptional regulator n=1 Tax=Bernardetia sp. OM2101 TaxID=3344876 RepID=UPI0035CEEBEC